MKASISAATPAAGRRGAPAAFTALRSAAATAAISLLATLTLAGGASAQKKVLDHGAYDIWKTIRGERISPDGAWVLYRLEPRVGNAALVVAPAGTASAARVRVERVGDAAFAPDSRTVVFTIVPAHDSVRVLKLAKTKKDAMPPDTLGILDLATGEVTRVAGLESWTLPEEGGFMVAYLQEPEKPARKEADDAEPGQAAPEPVQPEAAPAAPEEKAESGKERKKPDTFTLVLRDLATGAERRFERVTSYALADDGRRAAYAASSDDGSGDGVYVVETATGESRMVLAGEGAYERMALSGDGRQLAFVTDRDDVEADQPSFALYHWKEGEEAARRLVAEGADGIPPGWWVSRNGEVTFSENGRRLFFGTAPRPAPEPEDTLLDDEKVELDVWNWQDPLIQPMQKLEADRERKRTYRAVALLDRGGAIVQLATEAMPEVEVGGKGDADVAVAETGVPYRHLVGIDAPEHADIWIIDVRSGERRRVLEDGQVSRMALSPEAKHVAWYDYRARQWMAMPVDGDAPAAVTSKIPYPLWDEDDDHPMMPSPYGMAGWTEGDRAVLIYDRYDIWAVSPDGRGSPRAITEQYGRENELRLRYLDLDPDGDAVPADAPLLLSAFQLETRDAGFFRDRVSGSATPEPLVYEPKLYRRVDRARDADVLLYTREDVSEFPDLWVADASFGGAHRVSDANPQQAEYNWSTVELVHWLSTDGIPLDGLLYKPEDFDPTKQYPMMVTFYERSSDELHAHAPPLPHRSVIRPTFYASRGYIVFEPDVVYEDGYPGESAMDAVMPGVLKLAAEPWVDARHVGVQGHSWGGYQIAYMVTKTDLFAAAEAGAPVSNMTSAYGGIRWGTGMSRMFQYERTQSRIGGSLWNDTPRYIENSPLFHLDKVKTPLLIMHNDHDSAVPWEQGIELFLGLRRLEKPAWMIVYNDAPHWPTTAADIRDWNIRMQQFFDHYLKGAPAPVWMTEGIPATTKGRTLGLETTAAVASAPPEGGSHADPAPAAGGG